MNDDWWESIKRCAENVRQRSPTHLRKRIADLEAELAATKQELSGLRSDYQAAEEEIETQTEWKEKARLSCPR